MTVPDSRGLPDLPGGAAVTRQLSNGLMVPETIAATPNEQTFPQDLAEQLQALEDAIERQAAAPAASPDAPTEPEEKPGELTPGQPEVAVDPVESSYRNDSPAAVASVPSESEPEEERLGSMLRRSVRRLARAKLDLDGQRDSGVKHTPWPIVVMTGLFAAASTAGAFVLSFTMLILVMQAMGFASDVSWLGPIAIDIAALTAATFLVTKDPHYRRLGWFLLAISTGASIYGNLVGHAIQDQRAAVPFHLPASPVYGNAGIFFSIFFPMVMAVLVHCFMAQLTGNLEYRKQRQAEAEEAARKQAEAEAEEARRVEAEARAAAEREARAREAAAKQEELRAALPKPRRRGEKITQQTAIQYGVAHQVHTYATLRTVVENAGYTPASRSAMTDWCAEIKRELGVV